MNQFPQRAMAQPEMKAMSATMTPVELRTILDRILGWAAIVARFTPTDLDDKAVAFAQTLADTPGLIEAIFSLLGKGVSADAIVARLNELGAETLVPRPA